MITNGKNMPPFLPFPLSPCGRGRIYLVSAANLGNPGEGFLNFPQESLSPALSHKGRGEGRAYR